MMDELNVLRQTVMRDARKYADKTLAASEYALSKRMEEKENAQKESFEKTILRNTEKRRSEARKEVAEAERAAFKKLLDERDKITANIAAELRERLEAFAASPEYKEYIKEKVRNAKEFAEGAEIAACVFRAEDTELLGDIKTTLAKADTAGGIVFEIEKRGIIIDNSFDTAIKTVMEDFHEIRLKNEI